MTPLRCWSLEAAEQLVAERAAVLRLVPGGGVETQLLRDRRGRYWSVRLPVGEWLAHGPDGWHADRPSSRLEGPAWLDPVVSRSFAIEADAADGSAESAPAQAPIHPSDALRYAVAAVRAAYEGGGLDSDAADLALRRSVVLDEAGVAWTIGVRSASWYRRRDGRWVEDAAGPDASRLVRRSALVGLCPSCGAGNSDRRFCGDCGSLQPETPVEALAGLATYIQDDPDPPEPVAEPWLPPEPPAPVAPVAAVPPASRPIDKSVPQPGAAVRAARRRRRPGPRSLLAALVSVISGAAMLADLAFGGATLAHTLARPLGLVASSPAAVGPGASASTVALASATADPSLVVEPSDSPISTETVEPSASPAPSGAAWYTVGIWRANDWSPDPNLGATLQSTANGLEIAPKPSERPVYVWAAAGDPPASGSATLDSTLELTDGDASTSYGVVGADLNSGGRILFLVDGSGAWYLCTDSGDGLTVVAQDSSDAIAIGTPNRLRMRIGSATTSLWVNGRLITTAHVGLAVRQIGLAVVAPAAGSQVTATSFGASLP